MAAYTTIDDPSAYFKVQLYTGNGSDDHAITFDDTDTDMQPDMVIIKNRDSTDGPLVFDAVRGTTKYFYIPDSSGEATDADTLDAFQSDGFRVDDDVIVNTNAEKYVAWCWKANGSGSADTNGSINTSATSANTTSGFSIMAYTGNATSGATIGHGIGIVPEFVICKMIPTASGRAPWGYHSAVGNTHYLSIADDAVPSDQVSAWNDTTPSTSLITLGDSNQTNGSNTHVAWAWAPVQGFSKMGKFEGNGNADGAFVYLGFRAALVMIQSIDSTSGWMMFDSKREGFNRNTGTSAASTGNDVLLFNANTAEGTDDQIDIVSNGFKCRITTDPNVAETYIYCAWAEAPFVTSGGVPCNGR